jgi:hypothetical protein
VNQKPQLGESAEIRERRQQVVQRAAQSDHLSSRAELD